MADVQTEPFSNPAAQRYPASGANFPAPPKLHWALVVLFTLLTLGIFMAVWIFIQSSWARKVDPTSNATTQFIAYLVVTVAGQILFEASAEGLQSLGVLLLLGSYVIFYFGVYSIRRSMLNHYKLVEPMPLEISAVMTFFFPVLNLQYHMTRIAHAKAGG